MTPRHLFQCEQRQRAPNKGRQPRLMAKVARKRRWRKKPRGQHPPIAWMYLPDETKQPYSSRRMESNYQTMCRAHVTLREPEGRADKRAEDARAALARTFLQRMHIGQAPRGEHLPGSISKYIKHAKVLWGHGCSQAMGRLVLHSSGL